MDGNTPWDNTPLAPAPMPLTPPPPAPPQMLPPQFHPGAPHAGTPQPKPGMSGGRIALLVGLGVSVLLVLLVAIGVWGISTSQNLVASSVPRAAQVGDCFAGRGESLEPVSCDAPHRFEVYSLIEFYPGAPYPSRFERLAGSPICQADLEAYTGQNFWTSDLDYSIPYPTEAEWLAGDLETVCVLHHENLEELTGSQAQFNGTSS